MGSTRRFRPWVAAVALASAGACAGAAPRQEQQVIHNDGPDLEQRVQALEASVSALRQQVSGLQAASANVERALDPGPLDLLRGTVSEADTSAWLESQVRDEVVQDSKVLEAWIRKTWKDPRLMQEQGGPPGPMPDPTHLGVRCGRTVCRLTMSFSDRQLQQMALRAIIGSGDHQPPFSIRGGQRGQSPPDRKDALRWYMYRAGFERQPAPNNSAGIEWTVAQQWAFFDSFFVPGQDDQTESAALSASIRHALDSSPAPGVVITSVQCAPMMCRVKMTYGPKEDAVVTTMGDVWLPDVRRPMLYRRDKTPGAPREFSVYVEREGQSFPRPH